ncbi:hypothetical protein SAMN05443575_0962 [Jatrophihabitans endophyticus]|uniref:Uncharacterized protein n=1 Tax=Jatrophihabitans endophyticus TaxID=1206085 RepID=A0A1M5EPW3_9ACTN|nr:hypothetical protein SAMN05443575_0962 [Jatrophihabitans endophyticus]
MNTLHEALARDRLRELSTQSREAALARELRAGRRWRRVSDFARRAESRHTARLRQVAAVR